MREAFGEYWEQCGADSSGGSVYPRSLHYDGGDLISIDAWGNFSKIRTVEKSKQWPLGRSYGLLALVPFVVNFLLLRLFPVWRITDCPYCGFHEKQKLGLSENGEL